MLNNTVVVSPNIEFSVDAPNAESVSVLGNWDSWTGVFPCCTCVFLCHAALQAPVSNTASTRMCEVSSSQSCAQACLFMAATVVLFVAQRCMRHVSTCAHAAPGAVPVTRSEMCVRRGSRSMLCHPCECFAIYTLHEPSVAHPSSCCYCLSSVTYMYVRYV
jgi:hypothetical protein